MFWLWLALQISQLLHHWGVLATYIHQCVCLGGALNCSPGFGFGGSDWHLNGREPPVRTCTSNFNHLNTTLSCSITCSALCCTDWLKPGKCKKTNFVSLFVIISPALDRKELTLSVDNIYIFAVIFPDNLENLKNVQGRHCFSLKWCWGSNLTIHTLENSKHIVNIDPLTFDGSLFIFAPFFFLSCLIVPCSRHIVTIKLSPGELSFPATTLLWY